MHHRRDCCRISDTRETPTSPSLSAALTPNIKAKVLCSVTQGVAAGEQWRACPRCGPNQSSALQNNQGLTDPESPFSLPSNHWLTFQRNAELACRLYLLRQ